MITDAANAFAADLLKKAQEYEQSAKFAAVEYASRDDKAAQQRFKKNEELAEIFRKLHGEACRAMHAIEQEMQKRAPSAEQP